MTQGPVPTPALECFHCGLAVTAAQAVRHPINDASRLFCCPGCAAVAEAIHGAGLGRYYALRTERALKSGDGDPAGVERLGIYDRPSIQQSFVRSEGDHKEAALVLDRVTCAACVWLIDKHLSQLDGVEAVEINYSTQQARVSWDDARICLSTILGEIARIGYGAHPFDPTRRQAVLERDRKQMLRRIGVAAAFGMQVMVIAVALYGGDWWGIEEGIRDFLRRVALLLTAPVLLYAGQPFFVGAWRDLRNRHVGMDVPIALGLAIAFGASAVATITGSGQVYFESVVMFVLFVLSARYFELSARMRAAGVLDRQLPHLPVSATRIESRRGQARHVPVPALELRPADRILIRPGEMIPADGDIVEGRSGIDESLLTGESLPVVRGVGEAVVAGSVNIEQPLTVAVTRIGADTTLSGIERLLAHAQSKRTPLARAADRIARWFIATILLLATGVALFWWQHDPARWVEITVAVLIVTCPCALSLATPAALAAAAGRALRDGLLVTRTEAFESLPRATHFVFDKTGTLTSGDLQLERLEPAGRCTRDQCLALAANLESGSAHPIAVAVRAAAPPSMAIPAAGVKTTAGGGVSGLIAGRRYHIGNRAHIRAQTGRTPPVSTAPPGLITVWLADDRELLGTLYLRDSVRLEAAQLVRSLRQRGKEVIMLSGDHAAVARHVAAEVGIDTVYAGKTPEQKLQIVRELQSAGAHTVVVGDGVNDAPIMGVAGTSIALAVTANLTSINADLVLLNGRLGAIDDALHLARRTRRVIRQNLAWAAGYNLIAVPAAAAGWVPPWLAAVGMSLSSLLVVVNATRLARRSIRRDAPA